MLSFLVEVPVVKAARVRLEKVLESVLQHHELFVLLVQPGAVIGPGGVQPGPRHSVPPGAPRGTEKKPCNTLSRKVLVPSRGKVSLRHVPEVEHETGQDRRQMFCKSSKAWPRGLTCEYHFSLAIAASRSSPHASHTPICSRSTQDRLSTPSMTASQRKLNPNASCNDDDDDSMAIAWQ